MLSDSFIYVHVSNDNGGIKEGLVANSWANTINGAGRNNYLAHKI